MNSIEKIREQLLVKGFKETRNFKLPQNLLWRPDLVFTKNSFTYLVLFKTNNTIPPSYLNRISKIPNEKIIPLIIFAQRIENKTYEKSILSLGISIAYFIRGKFVHEKIKRKRSLQTVKQEIKKKLSVIDIFISSKQDIAERKFIADIIEMGRKVNYYPFNPPHQIEYDKFNMNEIYKRIDQVMGICEWVIILLEDNDSPYVRYEIRKAIKTKKAENIFLFVKLTRQCQKTWEKVLDKVKKLESIHYVTYSDLNELEVNLRRAVKSQMNKICKKKKVELFI